MYETRTRRRRARVVPDYLSTRVAEEDGEWVREQAGRLDLTPSQFLRRMIRQAREQDVAA